jgi:hypothetical protein
MGWLKNLIAKKVGKRIAKEAKNMEEGTVPKKWYSSKAIQGGVIGLVLGVYAVLQVVAPHFGWNPLPDIPEWMLKLIEGFLGTGAGALVIYGRIKASQKIG